jgi:hypothetical protein
MQPQNPQAYVPRCTSCGATALTPTTHAVGSPHAVELRLRFHRRGAKTGFFGDMPEEFLVNHARVCLACGHVMFALSPQALAKLRERCAEMEPIEAEG